MNFKKVMLVTLMLLAILTIGAVSASEDIASDNLTVETEDIDDAVAIDEVDTNEEVLEVETADETDDALSTDGDNQIAVDSAKHPYVNFFYPSNFGGPVEIFNGSSVFFSFEVYDTTADYVLIIDDIVRFNGTVGEEGHNFYINASEFSIGNHHYWQANYTYFDNNTRYSQSYNGLFDIVYYKISVPGSLQFSKDATGNVVIYINDTIEFNESLENFTEYNDYIYRTFTFPGRYGEFSYRLNYSGGNYPSFTKSGTFTRDYELDAFHMFYTSFGGYYRDELNGCSLRWGEPLIMSISLDRYATNNITVSVNGKNYTVVPRPLTHMGSLTVNDLILGANNISVSYEDSTHPKKVKNYTVNTYQHFKIVGKWGDSFSYDLYNDIEGIHIGEFCKIKLTLPEDAKGNVRVNEVFRNDTGSYYVPLFELPVINGTFYYIFDTSVVCKHNYYFEYTGDDYPNVYGKHFDLHVVPDIGVIKDKNGEPKTISINLTQESGLLEVWLCTWDGKYYGEEYDVPNRVSFMLYNGTAKGKVMIPIPEIPPNPYTITCSFKNENGDVCWYYDFSKETHNRIASNVSSIVYGGGSYSVNVYDKYAFPMYNVKVSFKVNGKLIGSVITDYDGVASIKLNYAPKTYTVTAEALGFKLTKKVTVKHALSLKTVKVRKYAKKLVLTATLKNGKKLISGKKITFKFNGKKYTAKTNKKGVAKVTIKKKVLKKLKVGKKVTYQANYLKDTVKKTAKVKR